MTKHLSDLGQRSATAQHLGPGGVAEPMGAEASKPGPFARRPHDLAHPLRGQASQRGRQPEEHLAFGPSRPVAAQVGGESLPNIGWQR
jgi:hypothetical protein